MKQYKESEWREEVKELKEYIRCDPDEPGPETATWWAIANATTRGTVLYFFLCTPAYFNTDPKNISRARTRLKEMRKERRKQRRIKRYLWRKSLKAKIYRWQLKCEYKRITKHDQNQITQ